MFSRLIQRGSKTVSSAIPKVPKAIHSPYLAVDERGLQLAKPPAPEPSTEEHTPSMTP